jgi:hypothetical protein
MVMPGLTFVGRCAFEIKLLLHAHTSTQVKWLVSAAAVTVLVGRRDVYVFWCLLGSIVNVVLCKVWQISYIS